jgi:hypothetical protein
VCQFRVRGLNRPRPSSTASCSAGTPPHLLHVLRRRMEYPELKRAVCRQAEAFNANVVLIEDKASGTQLIQELVELGLHAGRLARRIPARADGLPGRQIRRPGRLDRPAPRLAQAGRPRAARHLPILQGARPRAAGRAARAAVDDGEAVGPPPLVTLGPECEGRVEAYRRARSPPRKSRFFDSKRSWPFDGTGRNHPSAAFDLLSALVKCDFFDWLRRPTP